MLPREVWKYMVEISPSASLITRVYSLNTWFREIIDEIATVEPKKYGDIPFNYTRVIINKHRYDDTIMQNYFNRAVLYNGKVAFNNLQFVKDFIKCGYFHNSSLNNLIKYSPSHDMIKLLYKYKTIVARDQDQFISLHNAYYIITGKLDKIFRYEDDNVCFLIFAIWEPEYEDFLPNLFEDYIVEKAHEFGNYDIFVKYYDGDIDYDFSSHMIPNKKIAQLIIDARPNLDNSIYSDIIYKDMKLLDNEVFSNEILDINQFYAYSNNAEIFLNAIYNCRYDVMFVLTESGEKYYLRYCINSNALKFLRDKMVDSIDPLYDELGIRIEYLESVCL
jgi:hypothetical protein